ncbi:biotin-dependent carboxyltransferase family protein [Ornithinibacillus halotolerans]|uniref:Urea carboxylase n=1 Tax=Ornithinibacillus halotolerans TaxID=1274357 RepID=A0A916RRF6_9BACI|nr:biotin-dependent carboxyltransferase family protein [Ornithinibacillus halotolerans]GGA65468.1 urea carboxylase [Ornithinibacillus halotolerans]
MFKVIKPGLLTTIQDLGRKGYQKYGVAVSGVADSYAHRIANVLVQNPEDAATLEITLLGPELKALKSTTIAITGANLNPHINNKPVPMWSTITVKKGDRIHFKGYSSGCRAYLAVSGGFEGDNVLGSKSTDLISQIGGKEGRSLERGDYIYTGNDGTLLKIPTRRRLIPTLIPTYSSNVTVRVILGPQEDAFTEKGIHTFLNSEYTVSLDSDRMASRLHGPKIEHVKSADIPSEGMFIGAIQVPKNGLPILLQVGRQSIGGYTKIAGVISVDLPKIAQLKPKDKITFKQVTLEEAQELLVKQEKLFTMWKATI